MSIESFLPDPNRTKQFPVILPNAFGETPRSRATLPAMTKLGRIDGRIRFAAAWTVDDESDPVSMTIRYLEAMDPRLPLFSSLPFSAVAWFASSLPP